MAFKKGTMSLFIFTNAALNDLHLHQNTHHIWPQASELVPVSCSN